MLNLTSQWTSKSYDFTPAEPIAFPPELAKICSEVVQEVNWDEVFEGVDDKPEGYASWKEDYGTSTHLLLNATCCPGLVWVDGSGCEMMTHTLFPVHHMCE